MAASSDADIFEEVNRALQGFNDVDHDDRLDDCLATMTTVKETKDRYTAEIERLREDVTALEDQVEADEQRLLEIKMKTLDRIQSSLQLGRNASSTGIDQATQDDLNLQGVFTGIQHTDTTVRIVKQDTDQTVRQHCLQGQCSGLSFQLDYRVEEKQLTESDKQHLPPTSNQETRSRITSLAVQIDDRSLLELEEFSRDTETQCSLQPFLRGYGQYAQRAVGRQKAFDHFKKRYPDVVTLPQGCFGPTMTFGEKPHKGALYTIKWDISVAATGRADQQIQLQVMSSKQLRQLDEQNVLKSAPDKFQQMIKRLGIERTIDTFVQAVTT